MNQPRLTVVTPNFNRVADVERTICSVLDQGYDNLDLIVVDGGSTDGSMDVIRLYESQLTEVLIAPRCGWVEAVNRGLLRAEGDWVAVVDSGDLMLPGALHTVAESCRRRRSSWLVGQAVRVNQDDQVLAAIQASRPRNLASFLMRDSGMLPLGASFFSRPILQHFGLFDPDYQYASDYEFASRLLAYDLIPQILPEVLTSLRQRGIEGPDQTLQKGLEYLSAAHRYAGRVPWGRRYGLWRNMDKRSRIYALARTEMIGRQSRGRFLRDLIGRPWWLADASVRQTLWHGASHPMPTPTAMPLRHAA